MLSSKNQGAWLLALGICGIFSACKKQSGEQDEISKLPPATQSGAGKFACLLNGKAWIGQTDCIFFLCDPFLEIYFGNSNGGYIAIVASRENAAAKINDSIQIIFDSSDHKLVHELTIHKPLAKPRFVNYKDFSNCGDYDRYSDSTVIHTGVVNITKYDLQDRIISGTFEFTLTKPGCNPVIVTNGRFDKKF